jgi:hypothetical protein
MDRVRLALAQQNGVTAVILALVFERSLDGFVAVVAPAIVTINVIHALADRAVNAWESRSAPGEPAPLPDRLHPGDGDAGEPVEGA